MNDYYFLFDLDSTITKNEILPTIAQLSNNEEILNEIKRETEDCMNGKVPFVESYMSRISKLKDIPLDKARLMVSNIEVNENICKFIKENYDRSYIVTCNLNVWIEGLICKLGMNEHLICSKATSKNNFLLSVDYIIDKSFVVDGFTKPVISICDGNNDVGMAKKSKISIAFGGVRRISPELEKVSTYKVYNDKDCYKILNELLLSY